MKIKLTETETALIETRNVADGLEDRKIQRLRARLQRLMQQRQMRNAYIQAVVARGHGIKPPGVAPSFSVSGNGQGYLEWDEPKAEEPKAEEPKAEEPKAEAPNLRVLESVSNR